MLPLLASLPALAAVPVAHTDHAELAVGGFAHVLAAGEFLDDPDQGDARAYLFLDEARLSLAGRVDRTTLDLELALGGEETVVAPYPGVSLGLLDFAFSTPLGKGDTTQVKVGQFRVPYGREQLADEADLAFAGRSIEQLGFVVGRDVGVAVVSRPGPATIIGGVFTGGGRDVPPRWLPEELGIPMLVARVGVGDTQQDPFALDPTAHDIDHLRGAFFLSGLFTRDSAVGHSSLLAVKMADKSVMLDTNWNPYLANPEALGTFWQAGADAALRAPAGGWAIAAEAQGDVAGFQNDDGDVLLVGGRAQASARRGPFEAAARWAILVPDEAFPTAGTAPIQEITPAVGAYLAGRHARVILDVPVTLGAPVYLEDGVGAYVGTEMPDEAALLASGGSVERQTVVQARVAFQGAF